MLVAQPKRKQSMQARTRARARKHRTHNEELARSALGDHLVDAVVPRVEDLKPRMCAASDGACHALLCAPELCVVTRLENLFVRERVMAPFVHELFGRTRACAERGDAVERFWRATPGNTLQGARAR